MEDVETEFMASVFKLALTRCQDPAHREILEKGLLALGRIAIRPYPGSLLEHAQDIIDSVAANGLATAYDTIAKAPDIHMGNMRGRRDRPELTAAICSEVNDDSGPVTLKSAWKKAGLFRGRINGWLEKRGHSPASQKSIYDRIVKVLRT